MVANTDVIFKAKNRGREFLEIDSRQNSIKLPENRIRCTDFLPLIIKKNKTFSKELHVRNNEFEINVTRHCMI
jgi:hypothetical protein